MLGGLFGLDNKQRGYMAASCIAPTLITISAIHFSKDALFTIVCLQAIGYLLVPYLYIRYLSKEGEVQAYFLNEVQDRFNQIKTGLSLFASAFGLVVFAYILLFEFRLNLLMILTIPIKVSAIYIFAFFVLYGIVNPVLEEWFWRIFVPKTYPDSERNKWLLNLNYTFFHYVIIGYIMDWKYAIGVTSTFYSIGQSFEFIKKKYGIITGMICHLGMSLASTIALMDILYLEHQNKAAAQ